MKLQALAFLGCLIASFMLGANTSDRTYKIKKLNEKLTSLCSDINSALKHSSPIPAEIHLSYTINCEEK